MFIYKKQFLLPVLSFFILLFLYSLWGRIPDIDDAWIGEHAYRLAHDGYVHSELMRGINHQEDLLVVHHKLFNLQGALFIRIFGFSLYTLKAVSLVYFILFLILFYFYTCRWKKLFVGTDFYVSMIILFAFPWIFKYAFLYRPEVMTMTMGFAGYILLEQFLDHNKSGNKWILLASGGLFGLAMAVHLNGLILASAGFMLLLWNKKYLQALFFGAGVTAGFAIYFYDLLSLQNMALWYDQFFNSPSLDSMNTTKVMWLKPFFNLLNEHMRYFHNPQIIVFSVFMLFAVITGYRYLYRNNTNMTRFALLVAIITGIVATHKSRQYLLLNFPYLLMLIILAVRAVNDGKIKKYVIGTPFVVRNTLLFFFSIFLAFSTYYNVRLAMKKFNPAQNREISVKYAGGNEKEMNIVAPMTYIFDEVEYFNQIQGEVCYVELQKNDSSIYGEGFLEKAYAFERDLIMITPYYQKLLGIENYQTGNEFRHYRVIDRNEDMIVFKRKSVNEGEINRNDP